MNLDNYINENLDEIIDDYINNNDTYFKNKKIDIKVHENCNENEKELIKNLYEELYEEKIINNDNENDNENDNDSEDNDSEDDYYEKEDQNDIISELHEKLYEKKKKNIEKINNLQNNVDDGLYYIYLINIFLKYYNSKFEKNNNFFEGISNHDKDTSTPMELFFESIIEFKQVKDKINLEEDNLHINYFFEENKRDKIKILFDTWKLQIYCLEIDEHKIFSPCLLICLNYIFEKNLIEDNNWKIYNMRDL